MQAEDVEHSFKTFKNNFHKTPVKDLSNNEVTLNRSKDTQLSRDTSIEVDAEYPDSNQLKTVNFSNAIGNSNISVSSDVKLLNRRPMSARNTV